MNLNDLKSDIRYSLGDIKEEKFKPERILLAIRKTLNKLNRGFHLRKTRSYMKVTAHKRTYKLPDDFYFLSELTYNNKKVKVIYRNDSHVDINEESDNTVSYVIADNNEYNEMDLQPTVTDPSTTINIVDSLGTTTFDIDKVVDIRYEGGDAYVYYDKLTETVTATIEANYGLLIVDYIGELELDLSATTINFPFSFYDVIHFKVVADLLSDDGRQEVQTKSDRYETKYNNALRDIQTDGRYKYVVADLLTEYSGGLQ